MLPSHPLLAETLLLAEARHPWGPQAVEAVVVRPWGPQAAEPVVVEGALMHPVLLLLSLPLLSPVVAMCSAEDYSPAETTPTL